MPDGRPWSGTVLKPKKKPRAQAPARNSNWGAHLWRNASEIRLELSGADEPKVLAVPKRVTRPRPQQSHVPVAAVRPNAQQQQQAEAQRFQSYSNGLQVLGSYALRARGSEVMPPYDALMGPGPSYCTGSLCSTVRLLAPGHAQVRALGYSESPA